MDYLPAPSSGSPWRTEERPAEDAPRPALGLVTGMSCLWCGHSFSLLKGVFCPECNAEGTLDIQYDYEAIGKILTPPRLAQAVNHTQWRYLPLLPVRGARRVPPIEVGGTPLIEAEPLAQTLGLDRLWLKDEGRNPTHSIEDRAQALAATRAREDNVSALTCGTGGSAALAAAAVAASAGLRAYIFVGRETPETLIAQLLLTGARVFAVEGERDDAVNLSLTCAEKYGWYNCHCVVNPFLIEGTKTVAFELAEQLQWQPPEYLLVPVGEGTAIGAIWKGMREMHQLGWIERRPRLIGVQAIGAAPIYEAWRDNREIVPTRSTSTIAESLAIGAPHHGRRALAAVRESDGLMLAVTDREMLQAVHVLGERAGLIVDPGSAAALAGLNALLRDRRLPRSAGVALVLPAGGLDRPTATPAAGQAQPVPADFDRVRLILDRLLAI
jgi:threonine synthase